MSRDAQPCRHSPELVLKCVGDKKHMADDDVRRAYCDQVSPTVDGIFSKCSRERFFLRWRPVRIDPLLINPRGKKNRPVFHTHAAHYLGSQDSP